MKKLRGPLYRMGLSAIAVAAAADTVAGSGNGYFETVIAAVVSVFRLGKETPAP